MLGHAMFRTMSGDARHKVVGTVRQLPEKLRDYETANATLVTDVDVEDMDRLAAVMAAHRPDAVINCIGIIKQLDAAKDAISSISLNALMPHKLASLSAACGARYIHISTDCVFSGNKGNYLESDFADAGDLYGRTKLLGEVTGSGAVTLRTSIIGHELTTGYSLINWFLSQTGSIKGFKQAIFSGLPTVELATVIRDHVLQNQHLEGLYHVSAAPISKYDLLTLVARRYGKDVEIIPDMTFKIDRSLNSERFRAATGYIPPAWEILVDRMRDFG